MKKTGLFKLILGIVFTCASFLVIAAEAKQEYIVGFAQDTMSNDWRAAQVNEMKAALSAYPHIRFIHTDAEGKALRQAHDLQALKLKGADILVTSPRDQAAMTPVVARINKKNPVVLLSRKILTEDFTSFAGADDTAIARQAADLIANRLDGKGKVVMLVGVETATTAIARKQGFLERLKQYPDIEVVASPVADYRRHKAIMAMQKIIDDNIEFDAIYAHSDSMASGARLAMENAGLDPADYVIVGIDYIPEAKEAIKSGKQTASFTYPTAGKEGAEIVLKLIHGETVKKYYDVTSILVTSDNVDQIPTIFD